MQKPLQPTYAIIPTAGFGTRMLPLSKAVPKEMLPLGDKPAIHYVVLEAIRAGIKNIVLVNHAQKSAIENYFDINSELDRQLRDKGKGELADSINCLPDDVQIISVRQGKPLGLGHAVLQGQAVVGNNPFAVLLPDVVLDPFTTDFAVDNLAFMLKRFADTGRSQILVDAVADSQVHKYGIARLDDKQTIKKTNINQCFDVKGFVEKPALELAPSNLAVVGRYVFDAELFAYLAKTAPSVGGEIQLTDAIDALIGTQGMEVVTLKGESFDAGDMTTYVQAFAYFAKHLGATI
ncbi:UDP-glucose pyrophosphorylase [Moraxella cuniculi DSM 21768]|uniref:UTP--glucose-1-phosphate uridylyltransferase n=1 Tax=Moraxella cuniculi DSM 21768 TaxID=1122245 RepID=A0A1N7FAL8_9GAMM|nr:UTP--glucose-1-phosphate uridylyltransferase [Moraxella cuniculi]OOS03558.1 UTP--glucose-1-phosphate uridylyltransferase [Moraxella cuniculi]SIR97334.1 UDP-glucose pyrophosphorylase [Moraxella cuniculi DSM 21768]